MSTTALKQTQSTTVLSPAAFLNHWQGHRRLTRKVINAFPEDQFFQFSIGGMRTPAQIVEELLAIAVPGLRQVATGSSEVLEESQEFSGSKARVLELWDAATEDLNRYWAQLQEDSFSKELVSFGQYPGTGWSSIQYFIDNEIHHRGQLFVYLRALGIQPPFFWDTM